MREGEHTIDAGDSAIAMEETKRKTEERKREERERIRKEKTGGVRY